MIYFIQSGSDGPIKIGRAFRVERRVKELQTAHHEDLSVIQFLPGGSELENKIHKDLARFRLKGEWFEPAPEVLEYIREVKSPKYEIEAGCAIAVIYRENDQSRTESCPFCGMRHKHGWGDGHRVAHCATGEREISAEDGTILRREHGYIIRTRKLG